MKGKLSPRKRIHLRIRKNSQGTAERPRLCVFRSNKAIYCQLIDDLNNMTLASASSLKVKADGGKKAVAKSVGSLIAEQAKALNIDNIIFDRAGYLYHGRVRALAEGAREGGLQF